MTAHADIVTEAAVVGLTLVGHFHPEIDDKFLQGQRTLVLLGAAGPELWKSFRQSPEAHDGEPHPMDRWSERVITRMAERLGAKPYFPFGGPPWVPFQKWAEAGEGAQQSPVVLQVSTARGLWVSYRGALGFATQIELPKTETSHPCTNCAAKPCLTACPASALMEGKYDVPSCVAYLRSNPQATCHNGCRVRSSCPASANIRLPAAQRRFHMNAFLRAQKGS